MSDKELSKDQAKTETTMLIVGTFLDTTWRMFTPSVGLTLLGVFSDRYFGTKPWLMILGIFIGCLAAGILVRSQFIKVNSKRRG